MVSIRCATSDDVYGIMETNLHCLPENYTAKYFYYHIVTFPRLQWVAEDVETGKVVGYVMAKCDTEDTKIMHGHITSISVRRSYRRLGIASRLMKCTFREMVDCYQARYCSLHVRAYSNPAAYNLYTKCLHYDLFHVEEGYYADGEDAHEMRKTFTEADGLIITDEKPKEEAPKPHVVTEYERKKQRRAQKRGVPTSTTEKDADVVTEGEKTIDELSKKVEDLKTEEKPAAPPAEPPKKSNKKRKKRK